MSFDRPPAADDPLWPRASAWLAGDDDATPRPDAPRLRVVGVPIRCEHPPRSPNPPPMTIPLPHTTIGFFAVCKA